MTHSEFIRWFNNTSISGDVCVGSSKNHFKRCAKKFFDNLALQLGLKKGEYENRFNAGGPDVCGEAIFHSDKFYVQISQYPCTKNNVLYRKCNGRKDYCGEQNYYAVLNEDLLNGGLQHRLNNL